MASEGPAFLQDGKKMKGEKLSAAKGRDGTSKGVTEKGSVLRRSVFI